MFSKVLIANRGEIAVRIARTCRELGITTVAVYSDVDARGLHVEAADEAVHLPGVTSTDTYLNLEAVIDAAARTGAGAVHPGYGFFSERADAAEAFTDAGLTWIGPPPEASRAVGDKVRARQLAESAGVSVVPGTLRPVGGVEEVHAFGEANGYPIAIKAAGGGGGRGLRVAGSPDEVGGAFESAVREAQAYFGQGEVYLERYLVRPKHVEVQILAARAGEAMWLGARDCSLQRRHQKLVEETPPPRFTEVIPAMGEAAVAVANACGYVNAGTVEFLVDEEGRFYFLDTITEEVLGLDLVACQLRIAAVEPLGFSREDLEPRGHAIECRINAEDPARAFAPGPGAITRYLEPGGLGVRVDSGYGTGDEIPAAYDSLIAKLVTWGATREEARRRMLRALDEFVIEGVPTTIPAHKVLLENAEFRDGTYSTQTVEAGALESLATADETGDGEAAVLLVAGRPVRLWHPAMAAEASASTSAGRDAPGTLVAPMHGTVLKVLVSEGDAVERGDPVAVLEAMKMETNVVAPRAGSIEALHVKEGDIVEAGEAIAEVG